MQEIRYTTAETSKLIKTHLKGQFPGVKFSVRTPYYGKIDISFAGTKAMAQQVREIAAQYDCGEFDGHTDLMSHSSKVVGDLIINYSTQFVFVHCDYIAEEVAA